MERPVLAVTRAKLGCAVLVAVLLSPVLWCLLVEAVNVYAFGEWRCAFVRCVAVYEP